MNILIIYLYALKNAGHFEFVHSILEYALKCAGIIENLAQWLNPFKSAVEEEGRLLAISLKSVITEQLAKIDRQRDGLVAAIHGAVNAMMKSVDGEKAAAAQSVMNELVSLKVDPNDDYMNQTGQIDTLTAVLLGSQRENVEKIALMPLVQELKSVNDLMHELMNQRDAEQLDRMNDALAKARVITDNAYADFIRSFESYTFLNSTALAEDDKGCTEFRDLTNARVEYFRRYVLKTTTVPEGTDPEGGEGTEGEQKPENKPENPNPENPNPEQKPEDGEKPTEGEQKPGEGNDNQGGSGSGDNNQGGSNGGNNGNYPPGYDPDADLDPGV